MDTPSQDDTLEDDHPGETDLSQAQKDVLERCLHALTHAKNDSQTLAALLLITRVCPASDLDPATLRRVFEAVGLNLPARLLVTAIRGDSTTGLPAQELLSLGTALLAALSTDPEMAQRPQMLSTLPTLLGLVSDGPSWTPSNQRSSYARQQGESVESSDGSDNVNGTSTTKLSPPSNSADDGAGPCVGPALGTVDELNKALASDCYQVLEALAVVPAGLERLLSRGAVPALCRAIEKNQTLSRQRGRPLLGRLLSQSNLQSWERYPDPLKGMLEKVSREFCSADDQQRLDLCVDLLQFLPPHEGTIEGKELKMLIRDVWAALRPLVQSKLSTAHLGPVLTICACLLDLCGWECVGPPKFCCLLVNRACVEVRMGLEVPPNTILSMDLKHWITACYRIMEAAMEQACSQGPESGISQAKTPISGLSLQQSRQVLGILEEAISAVIYYLKQVEQSCHGDPFIFATFRCLCAWLAEETSCLKEEVTALLPFLIGFSRDHLQRGGDIKDLSTFLADLSVSEGSPQDKWTGEHALRYLLPALCHLTAEEGPRNILLSLDLLPLLIGFLKTGWEEVKKQEGKAQTRKPALETACSALLNITVTEPDRVRKDPSFAELQNLLNEALPLLLHKPRLLVLATNFCTLGLMMNRTATTDIDLNSPGERRFFNAALRFLLGALSSGQSSTPGSMAAAWTDCRDEVLELWGLSLQALGATCRNRNGIVALIREQKWLASIFAVLCARSVPLDDALTFSTLQEVLCTLAETCQACREEIREELKRGEASCLKDMSQLRNALFR